MSFVINIYVSKPHKYYHTNLTFATFAIRRCNDVKCSNIECLILDDLATAKFYSNDVAD
jgi:hypothetical protein